MRLAENGTQPSAAEALQVTIDSVRKISAGVSTQLATPALTSRSADLPAGAAVPSTLRPVSDSTHPVGAVVSSAMLAMSGPVVLPAPSRRHARTCLGLAVPLSAWPVRVAD